MELIKNIKESEKQSQELKEQAKTASEKRAEEFRIKREESLIEAEQQRKRAIEEAVSAARTEGAIEIEALKSDAEGNRKQLREKTAGKLGGAAAKVMEYLKKG